MIQRPSSRVHVCDLFAFQIPSTLEPQPGEGGQQRAGHSGKRDQGYGLDPVGGDAAGVPVEGQIDEHVAECGGDAPQRSMAYAQGITPNYKLVFDVEGKSYAVHAHSDGSHPMACGDGQ